MMTNLLLQIYVIFIIILELVVSYQVQVCNLRSIRNVHSKFTYSYRKDTELPNCKGRFLPQSRRFSTETANIINEQQILFPVNSHPNFEEVINKYLYYDRTGYITILEEDETNNVILMLRPRRMGKTLFLSTLASFHDIAKKEKFEGLFKGLQVHTDVKTKRVKHGRYFILKFNFSKSKSFPNPDAQLSLERNLLESVADFCTRYNQYYKLSKTKMIRQVVTDDITVSLSKLINLTDDLLRGENPPDVDGIYVLADEYDKFSNEMIRTFDSENLAWAEMMKTGSFLKSFWSSIKAGTESCFKRIFITGVTSMSMTDHTSGFNIVQNIAWDRRYAAMFGLSSKEVKDTLRLIFEKKSEKVEQLVEAHYKLMEGLFNGYCFTNYKQQHTDTQKVFNTNTCLEYFENLKHGKFESPSNSEVSESLLEALSRNDVVADLLKNFQIETEGISYQSLPVNIRLNDLAYSTRKFQSAEHLKSLLVHLGGLTFDAASKKLKVPNIIAKEKLVDAVLDRVAVNVKDLRNAIFQIGKDGNILPVMKFVADLLPQTIKHSADHAKWDENRFRDWVGLTFLQFPQLVTLIEQWTIKKDRRADMFIYPKHSRLNEEQMRLQECLQNMGFISKEAPFADKMNGSALIEFKVLQIDYLKLLTNQELKSKRNDPNEAFKKERDLKIRKMELKETVDEVLDISFEEKDKYHSGFRTIKDYVEKECVDQLFSYYHDGIPEAKEFKNTMNLYVVILVGGRRLLVAEVDKGTKHINYTVL